MKLAVMALTLVGLALGAVSIQAKDENKEVGAKAKSTHAEKVRNKDAKAAKHGKKLDKFDKKGGSYKQKSAKHAAGNEAKAKSKNTKPGQMTAADKRANRDERKAIKQAYKADVEGGGEPVKGKKPWWKFWAAKAD